MENIISIVMLVVTIFFSLLILFSAIKGFKKGWKWSLVALCRVVVSAVIAFAILTVLKANFDIDSLVSDLLINENEMESTVNNIAVSFSVALVQTILMPYIYYILFAIVDIFMRIPCIFINRAIKNAEGKTKEKSAATEISEAKTITSDIVPSLEAMPEGDGEISFNVSGDSMVVSETFETESSGDILIMTEATAPVTESHDNVKKEKLPPTTEEIALKRDKTRRFWSKMCGAGINAIAGAFVLMLVLMPTTGLYYTLTDGLLGIVEAAEDAEKEIEIPSYGNSDRLNVGGYYITDRDGFVDYDEVNDLIDEHLSPIHNNFYIKLSYSAPYRLIYSHAGAVEGSNVKNGNELSQAFGLLADVVYLTVDFDEYDNTQKQAVDRITDYISESEFHSTIVADIISSVTESILDSDSINDDSAVLLVPIIEKLTETTAESVSATFDTVGDIMVAMIDFDIFPELNGDVIMAIANEDFLYDILFAINENDEFRDVIPSIVELSFDTIVSQFDNTGGEYEKTEFDMDKLTKEELEREAEILAMLLRDSKTVINSLSGDDFDIANMEDEMRTLGRTLDSCMDSIFIGKNVKTLLLAILDSGIFGEENNEMTDIVKSHIDDPDINMENLLVSLQKFTVMFNEFRKEGSNDVAMLAATMRALSETFDSSTAKVLKEIINNTSIFDTVSSIGNTSEESENGSAGDDSEGNMSQADNMKTIMNVFVDKLAEGDIKDDEYEEEAKAVDYMMQIVAVTEKKGADGIKDVYGGTKEGMDEMIDSVVKSTITSASINAIAYDDKGNLTSDALGIANDVDDEDKDALLDGCEDYYYREASKPDADVELIETNLKAIASIFGEDISSDIKDWREDIK